MKGQVALPVIILLMLGLTVFYILWVTPEEREKILKGEFTEEVSSYAKNIEITPYESGNEKLIKEVSEIKLSYPKKEDILVKDNVSLSCNILKGDVQKYYFDASGEEIVIKVNLNKISGNPKLKLKFNSNEYLLDEGSKEVKVKSINGKNELILESQFSGLKFWETQKIKVSIEAVKISYIKEKESEEVSFEEEGKGSLRLKFYVTSGSGELEIKLNNESLYEEKINERIYNLTFENVNFEGNNKLKFEIKQGSYAEIKDLQIFVRKEKKEGKSYSLTFTVPQYVFSSNYDVYVKAKVSSIVKGGKVAFVLNNDDSKEIEKELNLGENLIKLNKAYLKEGENTLLVKSNEAHIYFDYINVTIGK